MLWSKKNKPSLRGGNALYDGGPCQGTQSEANCFSAPLLTTIASGRRTVLYMVSSDIKSSRER